MHPIQLKSEVIIEGPNFWGFKSKLILSPLSPIYGWMWQSDRLFYISINPTIVDNKTRRTRFFFQGKKLEIFEHIGVLRWFGLCGVCIRSSSWPPYYGRSLEFWQAIKDLCEEDTSKDIIWYTVRKPVRWTYPELRNKQTAFTEIRPNTEKKLKMEVTCSYPGLGTYTLYFSFPNNKELEKLCAVHTQGWPSYLYHFSKIASKCGWPHHKSITWAQEDWKAVTLERFVCHRAADLLGMLSLLCRDGLLSANVTSVCSGHEADIKAILEVYRLLFHLE